MGFFSSSRSDTQQMCNALQRREIAVTLESTRGVDTIIDDAYLLDPRLISCVASWSGNQSTSGTFGIKKTYRINIEYAPNTPENINDVIIDDGTWSPKSLISSGHPVPSYVQLITKDPKDLEKRLNESFNLLREASFGLTGAEYILSAPCGEYSAFGVDFHFCVDPARGNMWMESSKRQIAEIDRKCFGSAPKLMKVFLAFSYLQQNCIYDSDTKALIDRDGAEVTLERPWVRLPYGPLCRGIGICEGIAAAFKMFMDYFGIENRVVFGKAGEGRDLEPHSWNMIHLGDYWFHVDATAGIDGEGIYVGSFLKSDNAMEQTYIWDTAQYPRCISKKPDYSSVESYIDDHFDELLDSGIEERYLRPSDITE